MIGVFVGFSRMFLLGILIFKGLTARRLYKSFGVKGLNLRTNTPMPVDCRLLDPEDESSKILRNVCDSLPVEHCMTSTVTCIFSNTDVSASRLAT
jgi:hypothetical protein